MSTTNHNAHSVGEALTATNQNAPMSQLDQAIEDLRFADLAIVTLASDVAVTPTLTGKSGKGVYNLTIAAQSGTSDNLIEVTGISVGDIVLLRADTGDTITVKHNDAGATIKIHCIGDADTVLDEQNPIMFVYVKTNVLAQINALSSSGGIPFAIIRDAKATTVNGGSSSATTWNARDLNNEQYDPDNLVTISSNQFTPIAGTYRLLAYASAYNTNTNRLRLYNVTGASSVREGLNADFDPGSGGQATLSCVFVANGTNAYRIDHYTQSAQATNGLGVAANDGSNEVYLVIVLEKVG